MSILFTQDWDVIRGQEDAYDAFVTRRFIPELNRLGLQSVGGFYAQVGMGPQIISVKSVPSLEGLYKALATPQFHQMKLELREHVVNYSSKVLEPLWASWDKEYSIQKGVWKYNQYYDVRPDQRGEYLEFVEETYLSALRKLDYVDVTQIWNVLIGGFSESIIELTFQDPVDIGRLLGNSAFRDVTYTLCRDYVRNYKSRILRTTERFDEPRWFRL